ncbi:MAG: LysM peptidoglycan-binding domain-containing protein, partial [Janthinobacterium lividum]
WVLSVPLGPGGRELTLSSRDPAAPAAPETLGGAPVLVVVPDRGGSGPAQAQTSLAVLAPGGAAPRVLQGIGSSAMGLDTVDYDDSGRIRFSGHAPAGAMVRLYVDNAPSGDVHADAQGRWTLTPTRPVAAGTHRLRVDQLAGTGRVAARVELPFRRVSLPPGSVAKGRVVVQPGENLWRLARNAYGAGTQYTVIYRANRDQIRDPAVIYPGQAFDIPEGAH